MFEQKAPQGSDGEHDYGGAAVIGVICLSFVSFVLSIFICLYTGSFWIGFRSFLEISLILTAAWLFIAVPLSARR